MKMFIRGNVLLGVFALAGLITHPAAAQSSLEELIEAAGAEGNVIMDTSTTRYPAQTGPNLSKGLSEKFGVDITVELANSSPAPVVAGQLIEEANAGITPAFDLSPLPLSFSKAIHDAGAIADIDWLAIGVPTEKFAAESNSVWVNTVSRTVFYNTNLVSEDEAPTSLQALLDPKWKGKIAGPGFGDAYGVLSVPVLGEEAAMDWIKSLYEDQELSVIRSMTDVPNRVANGEFLLGMGVSANYSGLVDKGAPIANAPLESVGAQPYYGFVVNNAENPNAAALLLYFMCCTEEGRQAVLDDLSWAHFDTDGSEQYAIGSDGRGKVPTQDWQFNDQERVAKSMDALIGR